MTRRAYVASSGTTITPYHGTECDNTPAGDGNTCFYFSYVEAFFISTSLYFRGINALSARTHPQPESRRREGPLVFPGTCPIIHNLRCRRIFLAHIHRHLHSTSTFPVFILCMVGESRSQGCRILLFLRSPKRTYVFPFCRSLPHAFRCPVALTLNHQSCSTCFAHQQRPGYG